MTAGAVAITEPAGIVPVVTGFVDVTLVAEVLVVTGTVEVTLVVEVFVVTGTVEVALVVEVPDSFFGIWAATKGTAKNDAVTINAVIVVVFNLDIFTFNIFVFYVVSTY